MPFESIIVTGTSVVENRVIVKKLCSTRDDCRNCFERIPVLTTQKHRASDAESIYKPEEEFEAMLQKGLFLVVESAKNGKVGILKSDYEKPCKENTIPVILTSPICASTLLEEGQDKYMCFFLDSGENTKNNRRAPTAKDKLEYENQRAVEQRARENAHYILDISSGNQDSIVSLIILLWSYKSYGGALSQDLISKMIDCGMLLTNADPEMIKGASYDLRLGDEYYYAGKIQNLSDKKPFLTIEPYDYAIVSCIEKACIPRGVIAKFGLSVALFCQGIILSNGPQIDPGFRGTLFCLLFNTSNRPVHLKRGQHYATIEFNKTIGFAKPYSGKYQDKEKIIEYIPANALHGAINELKKEVEHLKSESRTMQNIYLGVVAIMFAILSILLVLK